MVNAKLTIMVNGLLAVRGAGLLVSRRNGAGYDPDTNWRCNASHACRPRSDRDAVACQRARSGGVDSTRRLQERRRRTVLRRARLLRADVKRRERHRGGLFRSQHQGDGAVQRGAALARRQLLAVPMGRHAQMLLRAAVEHLSRSARRRRHSFACNPRTNVERPVWRSRLSRSAARIALTSEKARSTSVLITT